MAKISDIVEAMIKDLINSNNGFAEITRGELARQANCVPSQVTYVLSTRFTSSNGYRVESRRGGGGSIRIYKIDTNNNQAGYIMHAVNSLGNSLTQKQADIFIRNFYDYDVMDADTARLFMAAISDSSLDQVDGILRDTIRMKILKNMLVELLVNLED